MSGFGFAFDPSVLINAQVQAKAQTIVQQQQLEVMKAMGLTKDEDSIRDESKVAIAERMAPIIEVQRKIVMDLAKVLAEARKNNEPEGWLQEQYDEEMAYLRDLKKIGRTK